MRPKPAHRFAFQAAALALLLASLPGWVPGVTEAYARFFAFHAGPVLNQVGSDREVRLIATDPELRADRADLRMVGHRSGSEQRQWRTALRVWSRGWWPSAALIAMVLVSPLPWRRRLGAAALGFALLDAVLLLRVGILAHFLFEATAPGAGPGERATLNAVVESFNSWVPPLVSVILCWAIVGRPATTLDMGPVRRWLPRPPGAASGAPQPGRDKAAGGVAQEGQPQREQRPQADESDPDGDGPGRG